MPVAPHDSMPRARAAAQQALSLDPQLAEAHTSLAYVQFAYDWDFAAAERGFDRALELAPNYATAHQWRHELLTALGRTEAQRAAIERAHALDPLSPIIATEIGWGLYFAREHAAARAHLERTVAHTPRFPVAWLVLGLVQLAGGDPDAACDTIAHALRLSPQPPFPVALGSHGHALARAGRTEAAGVVVAQLAELARHSPAASHAEALVHTGLGRPEAALAGLERALAGRADRMAYLAVDPLLDPLRGAHGFAALVAALRPPGDSRPGAPEPRGKEMGRSREAGRQGRGRAGS
jgi:tetratricopeptide (TPR) repeat protein